MRHFSMYRVLNGRTENRSKTREIFLLIFLIDRSCEGNVGGERVQAWRAGCGERVRARRAGGGERVHAWEWWLRASCLTRCKPSHKMQAIPQDASHPTWCKPSHMVQAIPQGTVCLVSTFRTYKPIARAPKHNRFTIWGNSAATAAARTAWTITISLFCMRISSRISIISLAPAGMLIILPSADV